LNTQIIKKIISFCKKETPCPVEVRYNEPMSEHTTFRVGGNADCWLRPKGEGFPVFSACLLEKARWEGVPVFVLGGGANIVVSDRGIRGIVLDTSAWKGQASHSADNELVFRSGTTLDEAAECAAAAGLSGLEFLAGMPGSIGGAVLMNARCFGREIADVLIETEIIGFNEKLTNGRTRQKRVKMIRADFGYKISPFQGKSCVILTARFGLKAENEKKILSEMEINRSDRRLKGHYSYPCAGSVFKNNEDFGKPVGRIIDELGLRNMKIGDAQVASFHGNIIINRGGASAADIRRLTDEVAAKVKEAAGIILEPEILFVGDWEP